MGRLQGRKGIVTGAANGIGRAGAMLFASEGASLVLLDTDAPGLKAVADAIRSDGGHAQLVVGDCSEDETVQLAVTTALSAFGGLDLLWGNAAIGVAKNVPETTREEWDRVIAVNLTGPFLLAKLGIPHLIANGGGTMVITGSVNCLYADRQWASYCTTKGALLMLCRSLAVDHATQNIRVNILCPGAVDTRLHDAWLNERSQVRPYNELKEEDRVAHPMERIASPEEVARAALFLSSDDSSFCTGSTLFIDGGFSAQ
jgi:NAD(P)-dependent dehydrogenase (short-subunit alcohol dehydrogenase family)